MLKLVLFLAVIVLGGAFFLFLTQSSLLQNITSKISPATPTALVDQNNQITLPTPTLSATDEEIDNDLTALDRDLAELDATEKNLTEEINNL